MGLDSYIGFVPIKAVMLKDDILIGSVEFYMTMKSKGLEDFIEDCIEDGVNIKFVST